MGAADWGDLGGSVNAGTLARGVTAWATPPNGGPNFIYGYNSVGAGAGAHGKYCTLIGYAPTGSGPAVADGGGSVRGCVQRLPSPGATGMSPFLFGCCQGGPPPTVNDYAYLLGLADSDPYTIQLAKAPLARGLVATNPDVAVLRTSAAQYLIGDALWHHLRLDCIVQPNGDVLLQVYSNDLTAQPLGTTPDWQPIPGMDEFVDDTLRIATGTAPLWGGCWGWAFTALGSLGRRGGFSGLELERNP